MAVTNFKYEASATAFTLTATSLADGAYRESDAVDNSAAGKLFVDVLVGLSVQTGTITTSTGGIEVYAYGSFDGTEYPESITGSDAVWTPPHNSGVPQTLPLLAVVTAGDADDNEDIEIGPLSIASAFNGIVPPKWGIVIKNTTSVALNATGTNNYLKYLGIEFESA